MCRADTGDAVLAAIKFNHERCVWHCRLCLLMPDHLHAIMAFPRDLGMVTTIKNRKKVAAEEYNIDWQASSLTTVGIIMKWTRKRATS